MAVAVAVVGLVGVGKPWQMAAPVQFEDEDMTQDKNTLKQ